MKWYLNNVQNHVLKFCLDTHHHHHHVAGEGLCVTPAPWSRWMARFQSSTGEVFESRRTRSIQRVRGRPGRRFQSRLGGRPTDRSMCLQSAMWSGTSFSNRAVCPKTYRQAPVAYAPERRCYWRNRTSKYLVSVAEISCGKPLMLSCLLQGKSAFLHAYISIHTESTRALYTRNLVVSETRYSFHARLSEGITEETK